MMWDVPASQRSTLVKHVFQIKGNIIAILQMREENASLSLRPYARSRNPTNFLLLLRKDICVHHNSQQTSVSITLLRILSAAIFKPEGDPDIIALLDLPHIDDNLRRRNYSQVGFWCRATNAFLHRGAVAPHLEKTTCDLFSLKPLT